MRRRYAFYNESFLNRQQRVDELESENRQQRVDELKMPVFFGQIPWGHHIQIITKCQSLDEALFYINKIIEEGWKRGWLETQINSKLYQKQGSAITNFDTTLPIAQSESAKELLKKEYDLSFITVEQFEKEKNQRKQKNS